MTDRERIEGWTHACLICNATWIAKLGKRGHTHKELAPEALESMRNFWTAILAWGMPAATTEEIRAVVCKPIARTELTRLIGPSWADDTMSNMRRTDDVDAISIWADVARKNLDAKSEIGCFDKRMPHAAGPRLHGERPPASAATRRASARKNTKR